MGAARDRCRGQGREGTRLCARGGAGRAGQGARAGPGTCALEHPPSAPASRTVSSRAAPNLADAAASADR